MSNENTIYTSKFLWPLKATLLISIISKAFIISLTYPFISYKLINAYHCFNAHELT